MLLFFIDLSRLFIAISSIKYLNVYSTRIVLHKCRKRKKGIMMKLEYVKASQKSFSYVVWVLLDNKTIFLSQFTKFHQLEPFYVTRDTGCYANA